METVPSGTPAITREAGPGLGFADIVVAVRDAAAATPPATYLLVIGALVAALAVVLWAAAHAARARREPELMARSLADAAAARTPERGEGR